MIYYGATDHYISEIKDGKMEDSIKIKKELNEKINSSLSDKIDMTKCLIEQWHDKYNGKIYVSFSGGKDSTVLLHIARSIFPEIKAVFYDTGLEYPEVREFINTIENVEVVKPRKSFYEILKKYGYN